MRKYFQFAALLVVTMLSACSGGTESKEDADTAMEDKPVVRLASVTSRDVDQIEEYTATVEAEAKNNIAPTSSRAYRPYFLLKWETMYPKDRN